MSFFKTSSRTRRTVLTMVVTAMLLGPASAAFGIQIPSPGSEMFLQTSGPNAGITIGDYYTSPAGGDTDHVFILRVPADWPAGTPVTLALYDPELAGPDPASPRALDEIRSAADTATFRLESPTGSTVASATYSDSSTNGVWVELATFDPGTVGTGTYELHVNVSDDDDNSWRVSATHDPDCLAGGSCASALLENGNESDVAPGSSSSLALGVLRASYQHDGGSGLICVDHAFFVSPTTPRPLRAHNFDMDGSGTVNYTSPGGGSVAGTVSGNGRWNGSPDSTRVGDALPDINGWWIAEVCISRGNQYVFEAPGGASFHGIPPTPRIDVTKDDGLSSIRVGDTTTYTVTIANVSDTDSYPGTAYNVAASDTLPDGTQFVSCDAPAGVDCSEAAGVVTATVIDPMEAGDSVTFDVTVNIEPDVDPVLTNEVAVSYQDGLDNSFPTAEDDDTNTVVFAPELAVAATGTAQMLRGDTASLTFSVSHGSSSDGSPIFSAVVTCDVCNSVTYDSGDTNSDGVLDVGETWLYLATAPSDGTTPDPMTAGITATGEDRAGELLRATTTHDVDLVDPGSISGSVFEDLDGDGLFDVGEPTLDGVFVELTAGGSSVDGSSTTAGDYAFSGLYPDDYEVTVDETTLTIGLSPTTANPRNVTLAEGASVTDLDFGYAYLVAISGTVFVDADFDTVMGGGELGLPGAIVILSDGLGDPVASTTTDATGSYGFSVMPGVYSVAVASGVPSGWALTTPSTTDLGLLLSGAIVSDVDFGAGNHAPDLIGAYQLVDYAELPDPLAATDPEGSPVTFSLVGGTLPDGLSLNADGTFAGASLESGLFDLQIEVCDDADPVACAVFPYQLEVLDEPVVQADSVEPTTSTTVDSNSLPFTGFETGSALALGVGLLFVGYILIVGGSSPTSEESEG